MLYIKPIMDKNLQRCLCEKAGIEYNDDFMAYFAAESDDCGETIKRYLGILQFSIEKDPKLESVAQMPGVDDEEAMIIMGRAVMSFLFRDCGFDIFRCGCDLNTDLLKKIGFRADNGEMTIDLAHFFDAPCRYDKGM